MTPVNKRLLAAFVIAAAAGPAVAQAQLPSLPGLPGLPGLPTTPGGSTTPTSTTPTTTSSTTPPQTQPAPPPDVQAPKLSLKATTPKQTLADVLAKGVATTAGCDETCGANIYVLAPDAKGKMKIVGGAGPILPAGVTANFRTPIVPAGRKTVAALKKTTKITLVGVAIDKARNRGNPQTRSFYATVPVKKKKAKRAAARS